MPVTGITKIAVTEKRTGPRCQKHRFPANVRINSSSNAHQGRLHLSTWTSKKWYVREPF